METFSKTAHTDSGSLRHRDITGVHAAGPNTVHDSHEGSTDVSDSLPSGDKAIVQIRNERHNLPDDSAVQLKECAAGTNGQSRADASIAFEDSKLNTRSDDDEEAMNDVSDDDVVEFEDDGCSLVVNMELPGENLQSSPATLTQLAVPLVTKPASSLTRLSPPVSPTAGQLEVVDQSSRLQPVLPDLAVRKMKAGAGQGPNLRSLPIHCVVELASPHVEGCQESLVVLDTYAILPGATLFSELVKTSLLRLGYSPGQTAGAKGGIQLKNWKTLMFEAVTDNLEATVEEILGEVTSVATLRINLSSIQMETGPTIDPTKDRLLQLLLTKSIDFLVQAGCPVEKPLLEAISSGEAIQSISDQVCTSFNDWYMSQKISLHDNSTYSTLLKSSLPPSIPSLPTAMLLDSSAASRLHVSSCLATQPEAPDIKVQPLTAPTYPAPQLRSSPLNLDIKKEHPISSLVNPVKASTEQQESHHCNQFSLGHKEPDSHQRNRKIIEKTAVSLQSELFKFSRSPSEGNIPSTLHPSNPYLGLMPGKTRIRTSFDPEQEIPRLQKWFSSNQHPTREQMMRFMHELNGLESRKGRRPLDLTNIIYWFKNARAAQRRATRALDDSFENEENVDMNSAESGNSTTDSVPPFLPNKNAVYMIPFHPYPHLVSGTGASDRGNVTSGADIDEPYDLSLTKRTSSELSKICNRKELEENHFLSLSTSPSPTKSSPTSSECESQGSILKKKRAYCPPRFPALLDVASKMRQEIPLRSEDIYFNNNASNNISNNISNNNSCRGSPYRSGSGSSVMEHSSKNEDMDSNFSNPSTPVENGDCGMDKFSAGLKVKQEDEKYLSCHNSRKNYQHSSHTSRDSGLELGQVHKEENGKVDSSDDDDNTNDSYNSEEELKLRLKQNAAAAAVVDYASAMHNNVSRLTAANMAALSLAQMGQPLHIPQLTSSLAMAYYPMDPRFYSQPTVPHSLTTTPPTSLANTHSSHLSLRQSHDCTAHLESRSPLQSPSIMQQSLTQLNHHHHHHQHHQQQSPQQHHQRHNSEPRKRRTRVFIDPLTEIPKLEKWFTEDTHPSAFMIDKFCEELNKCEYRHKFPKLEPKNIQLWFKNHRAKVKRLKVSCDEQTDHNGGQLEDIDDLESA